MKPQEIEDAYLRSLDETLDAKAKDGLMAALRENPKLATELAKYKQWRDGAVRIMPATFGPYFAQKVINRIQNFGIEIDKQIMFFFKKYQLAAVGVIMALLALNIVLADRVNVDSILGIEQTAPADEEIASFDFSDVLNNN